MGATQSASKDTPILDHFRKNRFSAIKDVRDRNMTVKKGMRLETSRASG